MIEIGTSDENVLKLFWFLNAEQRDNIRVNGTLLSEINEKGLFIYLNNICFWTSLSFEEALLEKNVYVTTLNKKCIGEIRNETAGTLSIWIDGRQIGEFDNKTELINFIENNIIVQFSGIVSNNPPIMKYEDAKEQTNKLVFGDSGSSVWDYKLPKGFDWENVQLFQLFLVVKFIGLFGVKEARRFLTE